MSTSRENILVTGGAGFLGSHLVERLLRDGFSVTVIDDFSTGSLENLADVAGHPSLRVIQSAVSDCADLPVLCSQAAFAFHLAAAEGVDLAVRSPIRTIQTNLHETEMILLAAATTGTPVLIASSSEVYGKSTKTGFCEEDDLLIGPPQSSRWSYACSKLTEEFLALAYFKERNLPVIIARIFNTVGPRQSGKYGVVMPRFISAALLNEPLRVFGSGEQTRCFCHVDDTVEALLQLKDTPEARGQVFNVGSTEEVSIHSLARRVVNLLDSKSSIDLIPYAQAYTPGFEDIQRRRPVIDRLRTCTGFSPRISLDEIIVSTADYQRSRPASS